MSIGVGVFTHSVVSVSAALLCLCFPAVRLYSLRSDFRHQEGATVPLSAHQPSQSTSM